MLVYRTVLQVFRESFETVYSADLDLSFLLLIQDICASKCPAFLCYCNSMQLASCVVERLRVTGSPSPISSEQDFNIFQHVESQPIGRIVVPFVCPRTFVARY